MIIATNREGQMCNQLVYMSHVLASALEYKHNVLYLRMPLEFKEFFLLKTEQKIKAWKYDSRLMNLWNKVRNIVLYKLGKENFSSKVYLDKKEFSKKKIIILSSWYYRDYCSFEKHSDEIRHFFKPNDMLYQQALLKYQELNNGTDKTVAIHIRRGDYREFKEGMYFYDDEIIKKWMCDLSKCGKYKFVLFSNEPINKKTFSKYDCFVATGNAIEDLVLMSMCDYIIGPPSTYSYWAAFMGNKLYYRVMKADEEICIDKFDKIGIVEDE